MILNETTLDFRDCKLLLRRGGSGPAILYLHGAGGTREDQPFHEKLATQFNLIVPDHPSFGRSSTPDWLEDISDLAYFYLDLLDELDLRDVHVIGHSMGGWIALEMAIRSTARIKSMTLIAPVGIRIRGEPVANVFFMDQTQLAQALFFDPARIEAMAKFTPTSEQLDEIVTNRIAAARMGWSPRFFNPKLRKWLHRVRLPTQIVWGEEDRIVPKSYAREFATLIPQASVTMVPAAGHLPHVEKLDAVASAVANFARRNV